MCVIYTYETLISSLFLVAQCGHRSFVHRNVPPGAGTEGKCLLSLEIGGRHSKTISCNHQILVPAIQRLWKLLPAKCLSLACLDTSVPCVPNVSNCCLSLSPKVPRVSPMCPPISLFHVSMSPNVPQSLSISPFLSPKVSYVSPQMLLMSTGTVDSAI
jgi:hypothetical protein